jgi:hypothetical protein
MEQQVKLSRKRSKPNENVKIRMNRKSRRTNNGTTRHVYMSSVFVVVFPRPVSPYALFFRDTQNDIKKKLANPSFGYVETSK